MKLVDLFGVGLDAGSGMPVVVLREHDAPNRVLPILVGGAEAAAIAVAMTGEALPRPRTHDLMAALMEGLDGHLDAVEVTELRDGSFLANLAIHGPAGERRIDTRPSDAIALAVRLGAPVLVSEDVLDEAGSVPNPEPDEEAIDEAVEEFRSFLDGVDPSEFAAEGDRSSGDDTAEDSDDEGEEG